ncbi:hypothetical protein MMPV_003891 [Pyropia vietnamensis]
MATVVTAAAAAVAAAGRSPPMHNRADAANDGGGSSTHAGGRSNAVSPAGGISPVAAGRPRAKAGAAKPGAASRSPTRGGGIAKSGASAKTAKRPVKAATPKRVSPAARKKAAAAAAAATAATNGEEEGEEEGEATADESQKTDSEVAPPPPPPKKVVRKVGAKASPAAKAETPRKALSVAAGGVKKTVSGAKTAAGLKGSAVKARQAPPTPAKRKPAVGVGVGAASRNPTIGGSKKATGSLTARKPPAAGAAKRGTKARAAKASAQSDDDDEDMSDADYASADGNDSDGTGGSDSVDDEEEEDDGDLVPYDPTGSYKADAKSKTDADSGDPDAPPLPCLTYASGDVDLKSVVDHAVRVLGEYSLVHPSAKISPGRGPAPVAFVVGAKPRRSVRLLLALARGAWIVDRSWALESISAGSWVPFHAHALDAFPGSAAARQALTAGEAPILSGLRIGHRGQLNMDVLEFQALVRVAGGEAVQQRCDVIVVGSSVGDGEGDVDASGTEAKLVNQRWLPDSICAWKTQPYHKYPAT